MQRSIDFLKDILLSAEIAVGYVGNVEYEDFLQDSKLQDAVIRRIEIIGEASNRIDQTLRDSYPDLPWSQMIGMRNLLIHEYDDVDPEIVWTTVKQDLPGLILNLQKIIGSSN